VDITINNKQINGIKMKLAENGIAFFVEEICDEEEEFPDYLLTSPLPIDDNAKPFDKLDDCDKVQEIDESWYFLS
jgi:phosphatidate phosphatase PAH1